MTSTGTKVGARKGAGPTSAEPATETVRTSTDSGPGRHRKKRGLAAAGFGLVAAAALTGGLRRRKAGKA
jgi:hypothetical protein